MKAAQVVKQQVAELAIDEIIPAAVQTALNSCRRQVAAKGADIPVTFERGAAIVFHSFVGRIGDPLWDDVKEELYNIAYGSGLDDATAQKLLDAALAKPRGPDNAFNDRPPQPPADNVTAALDSTPAMNDHDAAPVPSPDDYGTVTTPQQSNKLTVEPIGQTDAAPEPQIDLAASFSFLGDAPAAAPLELIRNHLPAAGVAITGGQSTAGKTFISIHKAICMATALPYFGHKIVERVGTAFIAAEGRGLINNRFAAALAKQAITDKLPIAWIKQLPNFASTDSVKLFIRQMRALDERFRGDFGLRLGHITIDTVAAAFAMKDEDDNSEATRVCNVVRRIGEETDTLVGAVHHYGKNPESGLRGASAWKGSADVIEGVLADIDPLSGKASNRELVCTKARDGEQGSMSAFELEFVELGLDEDREIYGSCCVVPVPGMSRFDKTSSPNKGQRAIEAAIDEVLNAAGQTIVPRAEMSPVKAAKVIDVRKEFDRFYVVADTDPIKAADAKRMAFKRALDKLALSRFGYGSVEGADWIWRIK